MRTATLDDFMALNDQIAALVQADVPVDVDLGSSKARSLEMLTRINAAVARRVGQGMSLSEALESEREVVPPAYRALMRLSLESGDLSAGLVEATRSAESSDEVWSALRLSGVYPLILCCLAYLGLIGFSLFLTPRLDNLYRTLHMQPGFGLSFLQFLQSTLLYWVVLFPFALLLLFLVLRLRSRQRAAGGSGAVLLGWLPGTSRAIFQQQCANFCESLSTLLKAGASLGESLRIAAGAWQTPGMEEQFRRLAADVDAAAPLPSSDSLAVRLPPFLRWALWQSEPTIGRERALAMAAHLYRDSARRRLTRLQLVAPAIACVAIGGGVTLFYGLVLFTPLIEMLKDLAS